MELWFQEVHFGKPHRIRDIVESLEKNTIIEEDENLEDVKEIILKHYDILEELYGKEKAVKDIRKHIIWYTSGLKNGKEVRVRVNEIDSKDKIKEILNQVEISENERAENISIDKFIELIDIFEGRWG